MYSVKDIYVNSGITKIITVNGYKVITPEFFYKNDMLITWHVLDENGNAVNLNGYTFTFRIDSAYNQGVNLITSVNADFVSADWGDYSLANGRICCRVDLNQAAILALLGTNDSVKSYCGLWATIGGVNYLLAAFDCSFKNTIS